MREDEGRGRSQEVGKSRLQLLSAFDIHIFGFFANFSGIGILALLKKHVLARSGSTTTYETAGPA
jgi:hypothetical protein